MLQNACKTLGFKKNMVYKIPPGGGEVNHIQPVAYNKFNNTRARMLDSIYHVIKSHLCCKNVIILSLCTQRCYGRHNVS